MDWAQLPETGFFPERGDIVVYEKLLSDNSHGYIGSVLACDDNKVLVAEGNKDNKNYSNVFIQG
ncbi:hypothetical protein J2Z22_000801 [Paenibacillus forsythiae]|uniref:Peptidase C51 domain-containing protein n=1 Tax=Paenibacillus forsythiae TaxID=365616 RepID=A0ABU3H3G8_9BACL|nr:hypothetical protein [Paenibacillus forsythiae]